MVNFGPVNSEFKHEKRESRMVGNRRLPIWPPFSERSKYVTIAINNFSVKTGEIWRLIFIRPLDISKRLRISPF